MKNYLRAFFLFFLTLCILSFTTGKPEPGKLKVDDLTLIQGANIAIVGNTLAERMQEDGWLETFIQYRFPEKKLSFRNLGYSADEVKLRQREDQFGTPDEWLHHVGADVIFAFFGFNESFKGEAGLSAFKMDLQEFLRHSKAEHYNDKSAPQIVLFSPIANEDVKSLHLPDGTENNNRIELYAKAMADVAAAEGVRFVDLFSLTKKAYQSNKGKTPFTINGIHFNDKGNKMIAQAIDKALFGETTLMTPRKLALVNETVKDKDFHWFNRYRTTDGYNVYGGRSLLKWGDQTNRDVMMREMQMFEVMTDNRDKAIWEAASSQEKIAEDGRDLPVKRMKVDDSNLPEALPVLSYEKGAETPRSEPYTYLGGQEAISKMTFPKDLAVNLFASEEQFPDLINPHQMAFDTDQRLWVATWATYPHWNPRGLLNDKILIFPDENKDGKADKAVVWADGLNSITGFQFWNGGVVVAAPPVLYFMKDTDGDDRADVKIRLLDGISSADSHHSANSFRLGPDGALYFSHGIFNKDATETPYGPFRSDKDGVYRFDPLTFEYTFHFPVGPNPHGDIFDQWGNQFATDATGGTGYYINIGKGQPARQLYEQKVRPVPGIGIISTQQFPESYDKDFLIANVIGFQGIKRHKFQYEGADIQAVETGDLISSTDPNFRPSGVDVGGDGALYILDWQNALIGHMQHNMRDPGRDLAHGRIYRMIAKDRPLLQPEKMKGKPIKEVLTHLRSKQDGVRYLVRIELSGRDPKEVLAEVKKFSAKLDPSNTQDAQPLLECLWISQMHRVVNEELLAKVLAVKDPKIRAAGIRVIGNQGPKIANGIALLKKAATDPDPFVRSQAVWAASTFEGLDAADIMMEVASQPMDIQLGEQVAFAEKSLNKYWKEALAAGKELSAAGVKFVLNKGTGEEIAQLKQTEEVSRMLLSKNGVSAEVSLSALNNLQKLTGKNKAGILLELIDQKDGAGTGIYQLFNTLSEADVAAQKPAIVALFTKESAASPARVAAAGSLINSGEAPAAIYARVASSSKGTAAFLTAIQAIKDGKKRDEFYPLVKSLLDSKSVALSGKVEIKNVPGRYVRISIPDGKGAMSIAELEVISGGVNIALKGTAKQSSMVNGGNPKLAIDGNTDGVYNNGSVTHTSESGTNPWWEVDLLRSQPIERINIYNRVDCCNERLENFVVTIFDENHQEILTSGKNPRPNPVTNIPIESLAGSGSLSQLVIATLMDMPGHKEAVYADLLTRLQKGQYEGEIVNALATIKTSDFPQGSIKSLADNLLAFLQKVPALNRDQKSFKTGSELLSGLSARLTKAERDKIKASLSGLQFVEITIHSIPERMKFDISEFTVIAGQPVKIIFKNPDAMPHNVVVLNPGKAEAVGTLAGKMTSGFIPQSKDIIAHTKLVNNGQTDEIKFIAPEKTADYDFICSFPGHWSMMRGVMKVVTSAEANDNSKYRTVYKGDKGQGLGKKIVFIATDHEYRSEESLPALARILAKRYGFTCTVLWALDESGNILPGSSNLKGLDVLDDADLMVIFTRFADFADDEMQHIDDYLKRGGPVMGFRTATHAFSIKSTAKWGHYSWDYNGPLKEWKNGFGKRVLGETWVDHYGTNHKQASKLIVENDQKLHPIMRGVKNIWAQSGGYVANPDNSTILAKGQVLNGMTPDAEPDKTKELLPVAWVRTYDLGTGKKGRVFATTHGASEDLLSEGFRRMVINASLWTVGLESSIKPDNNVDFVGNYSPTTFNFEGYKANVKPADLAGWESVIMPGQVVNNKQ
ncbi:MAG: PVC-type heme-binding CxxCH protein [Sphingobacteriaceae bacterium]